MRKEDTGTKILSRQSWQERAARHLARAREWTQPMRDRRARGQKHPVFDFLNTYYRLSLGKLEAWHPGPGVAVEDCREARDCFSGKHYRLADGAWRLDPSRLTPKEGQRFHFVSRLLQATQNRPPHFACHGMHEWAMVYRGMAARHRETVPLRLSQSEIDALVESRPLCCTHFDAFRFFAPEAQPRNRVQPDLWSREAHEQPGCIHANMDLYKWAAKSMPWVGSDLLWECFQLALRAREVDMRASPYDLSDYQYEPIPVETGAGRLQYETAQRRLCDEARPLRDRLMDAIANLLAAANTSNYGGGDEPRVAASQQSP